MLKDFVGKILRPLLNERGQVGDAPKPPDSSAPAAPEPPAAPAAPAPVTEQDWDSPKDDFTPAPGLDKPAAPSEGDKKTVPQPPAAPVEQPVPPAPAEPKPAEGTPVDDVGTLKAQLEQAQKERDFLKTIYNEQYGAQKPPDAAAAAAPPAEKTIEQLLNELPEGILPVDKWETQEHMVANMPAVIKHVASVLAQRSINEAYNGQLKPYLDRQTGTITALTDMVIKSQYKDFDDVVKSVQNELFTSDPAGKIVGVKDPATVQMIQRSPVPKLALYQWALAKKAPQRIKEAVAENTGKILEGLTAKPRPTLPDSSGGATEHKGAGKPDWDDPPEVVDKYLEEQKLL